MSVSVVILAAGKSTRFKSKVPKVLHTLGERPLIEYNIALAEALSPDPPVLIVSPNNETELREWAGDRVRYAIQEPQLGTGHAVLQAYDLLKDTPGSVLVLYGDMPLLREESIQALIKLHESSPAAMAMMTVVPDKPRGFGRVIRDVNGNIQCVIEEPEATPEQLKIKELNAGIYVYDADLLWDKLPKIVPSAQKGEIYLTDMVELTAKAGKGVVAYQVNDLREMIGINTRVDFAAALQYQREFVNEKLMLAGVTLIDPASTYISPNVVIGQDTVIHPNTTILGESVIGEDCVIGPNSYIDHSAIGNRVKVFASVLEFATMEDDSDIGPFSHLRKGAHICQGAHVGNYSELKNSTLGVNAKMGHFSYLGDTITGSDVNIGAGTITCNFDGQQKHPTTIGDNVFIGSNSLLVAPLQIGEGAKTGAGSVVTHDVPDNTLVYGVPARERRKLTPDNKKE